MSRTPTPQIDQIWSREQTLIRWHKLWLWHLQIQKAVNPNHPCSAADLQRYATTAQLFADDPDTRAQWIRELDDEERNTRHELVAALNVYNRRAGATQPWLHIGLTSCDITEVANQSAIRESASVIRRHAAQVIRELADKAAAHADLKILARTHGQPAQLTTYGHRHATLLGPLLDWWARWEDNDYPLRPPNGAVGTAADLMRVLNGWAGSGKVSTTGPGATGSASEASTGTEIPPQSPEASEVRIGCPSCGTIWDARAAGCPDPWHADNNPLLRLEECIETIRHGIGHHRSMIVTRQTYHRSYDLHWVAMLAQLATIAETWATDRRLEAMLGLGWEGRGDQQVGSSAMPHKNNPRVCERIVSLSTDAYANLARAAQHSGREWLEGDVAGSAARRGLLPDAFRVADQILCNWHWVLQNWVVNRTRIAEEITQTWAQWSSGAIMQALIESGMSRTRAHQVAGHSGTIGVAPISDRLLAEPIGSVQSQIDQVCDLAAQRVAGVLPLPFEEPM